MARVDYEKMAASYDRGRGLGLDGIDAWRVALMPYLPRRSGFRVLDLGAGTGQFSGAFATWFGARVIAVEPAAAMRREALRKGPAANALWIGGRGESIPLRDGCCDCAWLSTVIHHFSDLSASACELRRVVPPGGSVLIRGSFPGRHDGITLFRFFPGAARVADTFPTVDATAAAFGAAGFAVEALESVPQVSAPSLGEAVERVRLRADSTLELLSDEEFARGLDSLERAAAREETATPVVDYLDLLVLR